VLQGEARLPVLAGLCRRAKRFAMRDRSEARAGARRVTCVLRGVVRERALLLFVAAGRRLFGLFLLAAGAFLGILK
jgi:hypothetical protein